MYAKHHDQQQELLRIFNFECASSSQAHMKNKVDDDEASTLYLDWSNHSTSTKQAAASVTSSMLTTSSTSNSRRGIFVKLSTT